MLSHCAGWACQVLQPPTDLQKRSDLVDARQGLLTGSSGWLAPKWFQGNEVCAQPLLIWLPRTVYLHAQAAQEPGTWICQGSWIQHCDDQSM